MPLPNAFYWRLSGACFCLGACMELFMIKTGFYDVVTRNEAERWEQDKEDAIKLREQVAEALHRRNVELPPGLEKYLSTSSDRQGS